MLVALVMAVLLAGCAPLADPGDVNPAPLDRLDPRIARIVSEVSEERIAATLRKLASFETRHTLSDQSLVSANTTQPRSATR